MRHIIESCDACGSKTREFKLTGTNAAPQDGWFTIHIQLGPDRPHVTKSACSSDCAGKIVATTLSMHGKDDCSIDFCPGHKDGKGH